MSYPETLFELLEQYIISIPIVQRDYVQGMNESIINELLYDIKNAVVNKTQLGLNFVYGKTEGTLFIPIDGQQRLTTLFLLHLYACSELPDKDNTLNKFTYETRRSSREFLSHLCEHSKRKEVLRKGIVPSNAIKDAIWFHTRWEYDPTIKSALNCLDKIAASFSDVDNLITALESVFPKPIVFNFIPMTDMGMEDSIYIKLNHRGRELTNFETYKVELLSKVESQKGLPFTPNDFATKLDTEWSDYFWHLNSKEFDKIFRQYFSIVLARLSNTSDPDNPNYEYKDAFSADSLCEAYFTLEYLIKNGGNVITKYLNDCVNAVSPSYYQRLIFNAIALFLGKSQGIINQNKLDDWFRVISNLTFNTTIERPTGYISARNTLDSLDKNCFDILSYLAKDSMIVMTGFSPEQVAEECVKAQLILKGFSDTITAAEKHEYFSGQIRSGLNMAELSLDKISSYDDSEIVKRVNEFSEVWSKISALYGTAGPKNGALLRATLLTFSNYMPTSGQYLSFCVDRPEEPTSLKALFSSGHKSVTALLNALTGIKPDEVNKEMKKIVSNKLTTLQNTDWRYWLLKYPKDMFDCLSDSYMRVCSIDDTYLLVSKYATSSHCREIFTFALWIELEKAKKNALLPSEYGRDADYRVISGDKVIRYSNGLFEITDSSGTISKAVDIPSTVAAL